LRRVTADFSPEAFEVLESVSRKLQTSKADALRRTLGLMNYLLQQKEEGWKIYLEHPRTKERKEIVTL
jgi:hypothetical protein